MKLLVRIHKTIGICASIILCMFVLCNSAFAAWRSSPSHTFGGVVYWAGGVYLYITWTASYGAYYNVSGDTYTITSHHSGGCIDPEPIPQEVHNKLDYYRDNEYWRTVTLPTPGSAMCMSPRTPYEWVNDGNELTFDIVANIVKVKVISIWSTPNLWVDPGFLTGDFWYTW